MTDLAERAKYINTLLKDAKTQINKINEESRRRKEKIAIDLQKKLQEKVPEDELADELMDNPIDHKELKIMMINLNKYYKANCISESYEAKEEKELEEEVKEMEEKEKEENLKIVDEWIIIGDKFVNPETNEELPIVEESE